MALDLLSQNWLDEGSYVLCDADEFGFPILHASSGFGELYGITPEKCIGRKCGEVAGVGYIKACRSRIGSVSERGGLTFEASVAALDFLQGVSISTIQEIFLGGVASFVTVNVSHEGRLFPVLVILQRLMHRRMNRPFLIGLQLDVSNIIDIRKLLIRAASRSVGRYRVIFGRAIGVVSASLTLLQKRCVRALLDRKAGDAWLHDAKAVLRSIDSSDTSTTCSDSTTLPLLLSERGYRSESSSVESHGSFPTAVLRATREGKHFLVKCVSNSRTFSAQLEREYTVLRKIEHPCIIRAIELLSTERNAAAIVTEFCCGMLLSERLATLRAPASDTIFKQVLNVLVHLHVGHQIAHRALKAVNIMVDARSDRDCHAKLLEDTQVTIKLLDFSNSSTAIEDRCVCEKSEEAGVQASNWRANASRSILPPVWLGATLGDDFSCDVYAAGLLLISLQSGAEVSTPDVFPGPALAMHLPPSVGESREPYARALLNSSAEGRPAAEVARRCFLRESSETLLEMRKPEEQGKVLDPCESTGDVTDLHHELKTAQAMIMCLKGQIEEREAFAAKLLLQQDRRQISNESFEDTKSSCSVGSSFHYDHGRRRGLPWVAVVR